MTINELDKAIKDIFDWDFLLSYGEDNPKVIQVGDMIERLKKLVTENYQPKTTSTDIEELRKEFEEGFRYTFSAPIVDLTTKKERTGQSVLLSDINDIIIRQLKYIYTFFAPHLSNKSELKKEAVREEGK